MDDKMEKNSLKVNGTNHEKDTVKEVYRSIDLTDSETKGKLTDDPNKENNVDKMVKDEVNAINDGADEQMLGAEDNKLTEKREEVKFIKGDHQNGDAKIDIGIVNGKTFTGMTKEELMKYANDPFWVRLRWICFILFWAIWLAMLVGSIFIILRAPKCSAPEPLPWYKRGPLALFKSVDDFKDDDVTAVKHVHASGAIYELPPELTYTVTDPLVEEKIKNVVAKYKNAEVNVILDITPNYVNKDSALLKDALADANKRSPFIWVNQHQAPTNWQSLRNGSAWNEIQPGNNVLSQFGDGLYDLNMNDTVVKRELETSLRHLIELGVKGIRLRNTRFYFLSQNLQNESISTDQRYALGDYGFYTHEHTTFQAGLAKLLEEYTKTVKNCSSDAFVSVADDLFRPDAYQTANNTISIELPIYGQFMRYIGENQFAKLDNEMRNIRNALGNNSWVQWDFNDVFRHDNAEINPSAIALFISLLPGVPILPMNNEAFNNISDATFKHMDQIRHSPSYMHGDFNMYASEELIAYSRIKSGNPGYFVVYNPTETLQTGNFSGNGLPEKMTFDAKSDNYNVTDVSVNSKLLIDSIPVSPHSTIILTYVPLKSG